MTQAHLHRLSNPTLWSRIHGAHLPVERDGRAFEHSICDITGLPLPLARAVVLEYRRFLYLAAIADGRREPAGLVRVAWSFHAAHDGYGEDFCRWVLGRDLPFAPCAIPNGLHYVTTCAAYLAEFGAAPPAEIWPAPHAQMTLPRAHRGWAAPAPVCH